MINITLPLSDYCVATEPDKLGMPLKVRLDIDLAAKFILENVKILTVAETQELVYADADDGVYQYGGEHWVEQVLEIAFGDFKSDKRPGEILLTVHVIDEIIAKIRRRSSIKYNKFVLVE